ncbi:MAG: pitrilysin family protein [Vicingaceae bacterium]
MISFDKFTLDNGLKVLFHRDTKTPVAALNVLYDVGARDENSERTGFAHLFEHLMFGGSVNIPVYDEPLEQAGGTNNAFTSNDLTNYYLTLPVENIETGFWLESDRMLGLAFTPKSLEVQRQVVVEEFKQRYLNQPYGDVWLELRPLCYKVHPYRWPTIGKEISHIEEAVMDDVKAFFKRFYMPSNAILCIAGDLELNRVKDLCEKWFGPIPSGPKPTRNLPKEPTQTEYRCKVLERDVPQDAIYMAFHMCSKRDSGFYAADLVSDLLSRGQSSRLTQSLVMEKKIFTEIEAFVGGDLDEGLFVIQGKFSGIDHQEAEAKIWIEIGDFLESSIHDSELRKVKNKIESSLRFGEVSVLNKAMALCMAELLEDADLVNTEINRYEAVNADEVIAAARSIFKKENCSVLHYKKK